MFYPNNSGYPDSVSSSSYNPFVRENRQSQLPSDRHPSGEEFICLSPAEQRGEQRDESRRRRNGQQRKARNQQNNAENRDGEGITVC